jgi:hypothetical protein
VSSLKRRAKYCVKSSDPLFVVNACDVLALIRISEAAVGLRDTLLRGSPGWLETPAGVALLEALGDD